MSVNESPGRNDSNFTNENPEHLSRTTSWTFTKTASNTNQISKTITKFGRRNSASELQLPSLLKVFDIHNVNLLSYVNDCRSGRCPTLFSCYYHVREAAQVAKFMGPTWGPPGSCRPQIGLMLDIWTLLPGRVKSQSKWSPSCAYGRTDIGQSSCKIKGARLRNNEFNLVNQHLHKNLFGRLSQDALLEPHNKFIISSNVSVCIACFAIVAMSYHTYVLYHKTISKYETPWCWTTGIENVMYSTHLRKHQSSASLAFLGKFTCDPWIPLTKSQ